MTRSDIYQACTRCTAKWFGPASLEQCPRCGATTLPPVPTTSPFAGPRNRQLSIVELLESLPIEHRQRCLVEALGSMPPWSEELTGRLRRQMEAEFRMVLKSDWWSRVSLVLQSRRRHSTQRLLESMASEPSPRHLRCLLQHLNQRCHDEQLIAVQQVYRHVIRLLRHGAGSRSFLIDPDGWASIDKLLMHVNHRALDFQLWRNWTINDLQRQIDLHGGQRIEINTANSSIRARYGHTVADVCAGCRHSPPQVLYHGTSEQLASQIVQSGLKRIERTLVHLTSSFDYAAWISRKHPHPVVLQIDGEAAKASGTPFWQCNTHVWQTIDLPATVLHTVHAPPLSDNQKGAT
ncbi:MAG: RNA 2'-phosphotransferase [Planctomycetaceae bacterium]|nr:RNA 2'-phosphotransferase [Planctomycetaceae bacterium]